MNATNTRTRVEEIDIAPTALLIAPPEQPRDIVHECDTVCAHAMLGKNAVHRRAAPVHERRWRRLDVLRVGEVGCIPYPGLNWTRIHNVPRALPDPLLCFFSVPISCFISLPVPLLLSFPVLAVLVHDICECLPDRSETQRLTDRRAGRLVAALGSISNGWHRGTRVFVVASS